MIRPLLLAMSLLLPTIPADAAATASPSEATLVILVDGLRADRISEEWTPNLARLARAGIGGAIVPVWPALSMPNHWALVTGLDARSSGLWHNAMFNPATGREFAASDPNYVFGEPIWHTMQRSGRLSAVVGGWLAPLQYSHGPTYQVAVPAPPAGGIDMRATLVTDILVQPHRRPELVGLYYYDVDVAEHRYGVDSAEARTATARVDAEIGRIVTRLAARGLADRTNVVVVADHGHMDFTGRIVLADHLDSGDLVAEPLGGGPIFAIWPKPGREEAVLARLRRTLRHATAYRAAEIPARFACCRADRTPPILVVSDDGWVMHATGAEAARYADHRGSHAFRLDNPAMLAGFAAAGPAFRPSATRIRLNAVDVYSLLTTLMRVPAQPNDGSIRPFCAVLRERPAGCGGGDPAAGPQAE